MARALSVSVGLLCSQLGAAQVACSTDSENCDAGSLLQRDVDIGTQWGESNPMASPHSLSPSTASTESAASSESNITAGKAMISYLPGEWAEIRSWHPCTVTGSGSRRGTFNVSTTLPNQKVMEFNDVSWKMIRRPLGRDNSTSAEPFKPGENVEVVNYVGCNVTGRNFQENTYSIHVPTGTGPLEFHDVPVQQLRKVIGASWLLPYQHSDPAQPSDIPGQHAACEGVEGCKKVMSDCVAAKRAWAEENCGGSCDVVFLGDSIVERLSGKLCFSGWRKFEESGQVFKDIVAASHPKSLVLGGSCDETSQTLNMLQSVLPVLKAPKAYFVLVGTNNIPKGGSASAIRGVRAVVSRLREAHPTSRVMLHALLPRSDDGGNGRFQDHLNEANAALKRFAEELQSHGVPVDFVNCTDSLASSPPNVEFFDNLKLHPSPEGYRALLSCVKPMLDEAVVDL